MQMGLFDSRYVRIASGERVSLSASRSTTAGARPIKAARIAKRSPRSTAARASRLPVLCGHRCYSVRSTLLLIGAGFFGIDLAHLPLSITKVVRIFVASQAETAGLVIGGTWVGHESSGMEERRLRSI